jgi:uncharacterized protein (DUF58 family)
MDSKELLKKVRKVEIKTRGLSRHLFSGGYHSAFKGRGMSFSEVRMYQFGDDVRNIDWNVTARTGEPHIKIFEEERELTVMLMVDTSSSSFFGTQGTTRQEVLTEICAVLAFSAIANNDKVGLILFSDQIDLFIPPKKGRQHILRIIRELVAVRPSDRKTDLSGAIQYVQHMMKKRCVVFILSDFIAPDFGASLRVLSKRHDVVGIHSWDVRERELPDVGLLKLQDAETGQSSWVDTTDPDFRRAYTAQFDRGLDKIKQEFTSAGADFLSLNSSDAYARSLLRFFEQRMHKLWHS